MDHASSTARITGRQASDGADRVSDDGPGVSADSAEAIFERGTQLTRTGCAPDSATGRAGGTVSFLGGATFQVRLPPACPGG